MLDIYICAFLITKTKNVQLTYLVYGPIVPNILDYFMLGVDWLA